MDRRRVAYYPLTNDYSSDFRLRLALLEQLCVRAADSIWRASKVNDFHQPAVVWTAFGFLVAAERQRRDRRRNAMLAVLAEFQPKLLMKARCAALSKPGISSGRALSTKSHPSADPTIIGLLIWR
jgi:hypothetical protein